MEKRIAGTIFLFVGLLLFTPQDIYADSLVAITKEGSVKLNVLSSQIALEIPKREFLTVKNNVEDESESDEIELTSEGEKIILSVDSDEGARELDVTDYSEEIIEIEERPQSQKVKIFVRDGKFVIEQGSSSAETTFPIKVDAESAQISVETESGIKHISILPKEAAESVLRAKAVSEGLENMSLSEEEDVLIYKVTGQKSLNILNLLDYSQPIEVKVSASDGQILFTNEPIWFKVLGFLFE